ncbi:DNA polymerase III subunit gamma/tau, partial [Enterococcus faecalis]
AASPKGMVVAFVYEIVCGRATDDVEMKLALNNNLSRLMDNTPEMVCITRESLPKLRQSFINQNQGSLNHTEPENEMARL